MATEHSISITDLRLLQEVQAGETVVILNASSPVAGPTAFDTPMTRRPRLGTRTSPIDAAPAIGHTHLAAGEQRQRRISLIRPTLGAAQAPYRACRQADLSERAERSRTT